MTSETPRPPDESPADDDLGAPIDELRDLPLQVGQQFAHHVRGRIERRLIVGEFLNLAWAAPLTMLLEFLRIPFEAFGRDRNR